MFAWREIYYVQYCYNQKNNSSFCVQYPSCRLEPYCWNTITILMSPAFFDILTQKLFANQLVMNISQRLSNKRRILNTSSSKNHEQTTCYVYLTPLPQTIIIRLRFYGPIEKLRWTGFHSPNTDQFNKKFSKHNKMAKTELVWLNSTYLYSFDWSGEDKLKQNQKLSFVWTLK